ncbi:agrin-like isoform X3 [Megalops cyprinoides]|uniref:agrin-like isoform X3 n=1 Tax=Megalops cyprinoides TaxID=118141 RepID=UPI001864DCCC|nr:agrin-like isoform X3 [Megalops cyprinoides]
MTSCHYPASPPERERMYQHKVSLVVRYFMIPCNICLILLATCTLGFAVLLFLNNYKPVNFSTAPPPDGCRGMLCGFGAVCERDPTDPAKGECVCKKMVCPSVVAPVCGSDSSTYSNECELEKAQCSTQRRLKVIRKGPCGLKDPCSKVVCSYGSTCAQSSDGLSAKCMCPLSCEAVPEQVVCGSDGRDYRSECELNKHACKEQKNIRKQHPGPCDPCKDEKNKPKVGCMVEVHSRRALTFAPPESCPRDSKPLCASDGQTYDSECWMQRTALQKGVELRQIHPGPCKKQEECKEECRFNAACLVDALGPRCSCEPLQCDGTYKPLCGKDGRTYSNDCQRRKAECQAKAAIPVKQQGPCDLHTPSPCRQKSCEFGAVCVVQDGEPVCECPGACPQARDPVCGSDGQTYGSQCEMKAMGCALQKDISIQHRGPCTETCKNCSFGAICDGQTGSCVCPTECVDSQQPVCGSDGVTYGNECELHVRACTTQQDLKVVAQGECKTCGGAVCAWGARCVRNECRCQECPAQPPSPVCGSDGVTYDNACELAEAACFLKKKITVARAGSCDEDCGSGGSGSGGDGTCEQDRCRKFGGAWDEDAEDVRCVCDFSCHSVPRNQVCGSNGHTYSNECELKKARCEKQEELRIQSQGPCTATPPPGLTQHCSQTAYGCCRDNATAALGVGLAGCPSTCQCNPYGSYGGSCDPTSGQCSCKPGVGGQKCDRCEPGFWNFRGIVTESTSGCTPCNCDALGSVRDDCEQMSGLCSCKTGVKGMKCNVCPDGSRMSASGCDKGPHAPKSCADLECKFGASCVEVDGQAHCECPSPDCDVANKTKVCGSDGVTYADQCQLKTIACRQDKDITVKHQGQCTESGLQPGPAPRPTPSPSTARATPSTARVTTSPARATPSAARVTTSPARVVTSPARATTSAAPATPSTARARLTTPRRGHTVTPSLRGKETGAPVARDPSLVEALPPGAFQEPEAPFPEPIPGPSPSAPSALFEDSGSGEPSGDDEVEASGEKEGSGEEPADPKGLETAFPRLDVRSSCDNSPFGCCPDGTTATSDPEGTNCPPTMKFSGFLHLDQVEGQEVFYTPEMEDPKSELFGETARSIESALNELFRKSDVQKDFKSVRVRNLAPSNSILAFVDAHFDPDTKYVVEDVERALLKQLKAAKETTIVVKKPVEQNIRLNNYGLSTVPFFTTTTITMATATATVPSTTAPLTTRRPGTTRRPTTGRRTTTVAPATTPRAAAAGTKPPTPCDSHPCSHGGTCEDDGKEFTCTCPAGRGGTVCEKAIKYFIPSFGGKSFLAFPTAKAYYMMRIAMEFRASEMTGLLLYNGHSSKKDFLSLALVSGYVQLRFDTGSGMVTLQSRVRVQPGRWHHLVVSRHRRNGVLSVDSEASVEGQSPAGTDGLNVDTPLFVGGVPEEMLQGVKEQTSVTVGLVGCIRTLDVNNAVHNLQEDGGQVMYGVAVGECGNDPCKPNPCKNGATCQTKEAEMFHCKCADGFSGPTCADTHNPCDPNKCHPSSQCQVLPEGGYKCECPMGREGRHCERESKPDKREAYIPFFSGDSYLELKGLHTYGQDLQNKVNMTVVLLANESNGMIFYNGQKNDGKGDFISLALHDGILEFRYDLGKGPAVIRSNERIKMNEWNTVNLQRNVRKGELSVNGGAPARGESKKSRKNDNHALNLKESLFVGGAPDFSKLARLASLSSGFKGAIQKITLMGIPILKRENALSSRDVSSFRHHPCARDVCMNGGLCHPQLGGYECSCQHGFSGKNCQSAIIEKSAGEAESIAFDGRTFIEYHNAVTKSEKAMQVNRFELSIRTEATHGLILWSGKGLERSDYIALAVVDGHIQMTYDLGSKPVVLRSSVRVNTNQWIRIKASRVLREGSLQVGNEAAVTGSSPLAATQLDTDGALWLGGLEELSVTRRLPKAYSTGFVGCVRDVSVDGVELHLVEDALNSPKILHCSAK